MTNRENFFIEGLQGAGKTTFVQLLSERLPEYQVFHEGDYSPVELAWCAYVMEEQYQNILRKYPTLVQEITEKTVTEGEHKIICYTQILTDIPNFHKDLEQYEIYNGNLDRTAFETVLLKRFRNWNGEGQIFECSIFQNIIENQILYFMMTDGEILNFYKQLKQILADRKFQIIYLNVEDIEDSINVIRKERSDEKGNELWFPLMLQYLENSPYGKAYNLSGLEGLLAHLAHRKALELRILEEVFKEKTVIVRAKNYVIEEILTKK